MPLAPRPASKTELRIALLTQTAGPALELHTKSTAVWPREWIKRLSMRLIAPGPLPLGKWLPSQQLGSGGGGGRAGGGSAMPPSIPAAKTTPPTPTPAKAV